MLFSEVFRGREDDFALAVTHGYVRAGRPVAARDLHNHLKGTVSAGIYLLRTDNTCRLLVLDVDEDDSEAAAGLARTLSRFVSKQAILVERTGGRGWHVWAAWDGWHPAGKVQALGFRVLAEAEVEATVEVYPKQAVLPEGGFGNLVRMPLGKHPKTKKEGALYNYDLSPAEFTWVGKKKDVRFTDLKYASPDVLLEIEAPEPERVGVKPGQVALPCMTNFHKGVDEGFRDAAMFRLAAFYWRQGIDKEAAWEAIKQVNQRNRPPLTERVLRQKLDQGYSGRYGLPCGDDRLRETFCLPFCPVLKAASRSPLADEGSPVAERGGETWVRQSKRWKKIASFRAEPVLRVTVGGVEVMRLKVSGGGRTGTIDMPKEAFTSRRQMISNLPYAEWAWYGSDAEAQLFMSYLTQGAQRVPLKRGVPSIGRHGEIWVAPGLTFAAEGVLDDPNVVHVRLPAYPQLHVDYSKETTKDRLKTQLKRMMDLNRLSVMLPLAGWLLAVPFKPDILKFFGHFPLLSLYGTRGAGKSHVVQRALLPLFGYDPREPQTLFVDSTDFVRTSFGAASTTIPVFFDDYRPSSLTQERRDSVWDLWRHTYSGDTAYRGQRDLSRVSYPQTTPLIVAGEELIEDPALMERFLQVGLSPDWLGKKEKTAFEKVVSWHRPGMARQLARAALSMGTGTADKIAKAARVEAGRLYPGLQSFRILDNVAVALFGLAVWERLTGEELADSDKAGLLDQEGLVVGREGLRTELWADGFVADVITMMEAEGGFKTWGELIGNDLWFNLNGAYADWEIVLRRRGRKAPSKKAIKRQMAESGATYVKSLVEDRRVGLRNQRVVHVDLVEFRKATGD